METILQKNIKQQLKKKNISVAELERRAGLKHAVINIMHGRSKNPSIKVAQAIAKELGCSIEELITETDLGAFKFAVAENKHSDSFEYFHCNHDNLGKNANNIASVPWESNLCSQIFEFLQGALVEKNINISMSEFLKYFNEIYNYCYGSPDKKADKRFIDWYVNRTILKL